MENSSATQQVFTDLPGWGAGRASWECPSNIAIVKYWGKHGRQLPRNPSLSMTLANAVTRTTLKWAPLPAGQEGPVLSSFTFEGQPAPAFAEKCARFLTSITDIFPWLKAMQLEIETSNTFPHSAGIASSASGMGALGLCLCSMGEQLKGLKPSGTSDGSSDSDTSDPSETSDASSATEVVDVADKASFYKNASYVARLGSGSASRSVYGGWTVWGASDFMHGSNNEEAVPVPEVHENFAGYRDAILIVSDGEKPVSSRAGHALMDDHPQAEMRYSHARERLGQLMQIMREGDLHAFALLAEKEALELHALMMTSEPPYLLMRPGSLAIMEKIRAKRTSENWPIGFTLDAGPNIHLLYPTTLNTEVKNFIETELQQHCHNGQVIYDQVGDGPLTR